MGNQSNKPLNFDVKEYRRRLNIESEKLRTEFMIKYQADNGLEKGSLIRFKGLNLKVGGFGFNNTHFPLIQCREVVLVEGVWRKKEGMHLHQILLDEPFEFLQNSTKKGGGTNVAPLRRNWSRSKGVRAGGKIPTRH